MNVRKKLHVGPGTENNPIGPVIDDKAFKNINEYIEIGKEEGKLAFGGNSDNTEGYYITPTIFKDVAPGSRIMKEEILGRFWLYAKHRVLKKESMYIMILSLD